MQHIYNHKYIKDGFLDIRLRLLFLILGITILFILRPWIAQQNYKRAMTFYNSGNYKRTIIHLNRAIFTFPKLIYAYDTLGMVYERIGEDEKAVSVYKRSVLADPGNSQGYYNIGVYYATRKKDYPAAVNWFKQAINADSRNWAAYRWLGIYYELIGADTLALSNYQEMHKVFPRDARIEELKRALQEPKNMQSSGKKPLDNKRK